MNTYRITATWSNGEVTRHIVYAYTLSDAILDCWLERGNRGPVTIKSMRGLCLAYDDLSVKVPAMQYSEAS